MLGNMDPTRALFRESPRPGAQKSRSRASARATPGASSGVHVFQGLATTKIRIIKHPKRCCFQSDLHTPMLHGAGIFSNILSQKSPRNQFVNIPAAWSIWLTAVTQ